MDAAGNAIEFEYGRVKGTFVKLVAPPLFLCMGVVLIVLAFTAVVYEDSSTLERYLGPIVLPAIGAVFLRLSVLYFESRHAFTTRYVVHDDGIDVHPYGELPRSVMWSEIDKVVIWRFYQWCELHTRTLQKPVIISNTKSDISQADFKAGLRFVQQNVHVPIELRVF